MLDLVLLLAQGLAEFVQRGLDLIGERLGVVPGGVENSFACCINRRDTSALSACSSSLNSLELNIDPVLCCIIQPKFYASQWSDRC